MTSELINTDTTERKRVREALRESEAKLKEAQRLIKGTNSELIIEGTGMVLLVAEAWSTSTVGGPFPPIDGYVSINLPLLMGHTKLR